MLSSAGVDTIVNHYWCEWALNPEQIEPLWKYINFYPKFLSIRISKEISRVCQTVFRYAIEPVQYV